MRNRLVNSVPRTNTAMNVCAPSGVTNTFAVRGVKLVQTGAGSFQNLSQAATTEIVP